jgi:hypothetical protein
MTTPPPSPGSLLQRGAGQPGGCAGCSRRAGESVLDLAVANLARKYTELAEVYTR